MTYLCKNILGYLYFESSSDNPRFINTIFFVATLLINEYLRWINVEKFDYLVFATFWSFYKILATLTLQQILDFWNFLQHFFATFLLQKSRSLQHYLMLQGKMSMLQKKTYVEGSWFSVGHLGYWVITFSLKHLVYFEWLRGTSIVRKWF